MRVTVNESKCGELSSSPLPSLTEDLISTEARAHPHTVSILGPHSRPWTCPRPRSGEWTGWDTEHSSLNPCPSDLVATAVGYWLPVSSDLTACPWVQYPSQSIFPMGPFYKVEDYLAFLSSALIVN